GRAGRGIGGALVAESLPELEQAVLPNRRFEHVAVDDDARRAAAHDVENGADVGGPVAGEALVRPAKRVRSEDHIVELEDGIAGVGRLCLQDIEYRAGDL